MFIDEVKIRIGSGKGGDGLVAFRREKYVPMGGPAGGSGGRGGDIVFEADLNVNTLIDLRFNRLYKAQDGQNGMPKNMDGKNGEDLIIKVPVGTTVYDNDTDKVVGDLVNHGQTVIAAKGGRGGRGNTKFASSRNSAPEIAEKGEPGFDRDLRIELKVLADVGLVGFPSVGKSTLISVVSKARPKIAAYHFTTLNPNLGVVRVADGRSFVMADLPGLIEGASLGSGLGLEFLKHIERTRVIVHVIDISGSEGRDPYDDFLKINKELGNYKESLLKRPQIIVANKMDLNNAEENLELLKSKIKDEYPIIPISAYTKDNLDKLLYEIADLLDKTEYFDLYDEDDFDDLVTYTFTPEDKLFEITRDDDGVYVVTGKGLEKIFKMTDFSKEQSVKRFSRQLRGIGVDQALREKGVKHRDIVRIFDFEFEFID